MPGPSLNKVLVTDTFRQWVTKTNAVITLIKNQALTVSANNDVTTGNASLLGTLESNLLKATQKVEVKTIKPKTGTSVTSLSRLEINSSNTNSANFSSSIIPEITFTDNVESWKFSLGISPEDTVSLIYNNISTKLKVTTSEAISFEDGNFITGVQAPTFKGELVGNAGTATNAVYTDDNQIISGLKIFSDVIVAPVFTADLEGNASLIQNGFYTVGNQTVADTKTFNSPIAMTPSAQATLPDHAVRSSRLLSNGTGITGGGDLSVNRNFSIAGQMLSFHNVNTNGFPFRITDDTFASRSYETGAGILLTNGDGVAGNPTFTPDLASRQEIGERTSTIKLVTPLRLFEGDSRYSATKWAYQSTPVAGTSHIWSDVAYGRLIAVTVSTAGASNRVMTTYDGINWTARVAASDAKNWRAVAYSPSLDLFVAVANGGTATQRAMSSPDGINWTIRTTPNDNTWNSVAWGAGIFVAVASTGAGNRVMTSTNGTTWTSRSSAADEDWQSVTFGAGLFVAVAASGSGNRVMTSPDGINWTIRTSAADNSWRSVAFGASLFVAVANSGTTNRIMTSPNGITWTIRTAPNSNNWRCVTFGHGLFVAGALSGLTDSVMASLDGITWSARTTPPNSLINSLVPISSGFLGVGSNNTCYITE